MNQTNPDGCGHWPIGINDRISSIINRILNQLLLTNLASRVSPCGDAEATTVFLQTRRMNWTCRDGSRVIRPWDESWKSSWHVKATVVFRHFFWVCGGQPSQLMGQWCSRIQPWLFDIIWFMTHRLVCDSTSHRWFTYSIIHMHIMHRKSQVQGYWETASTIYCRYRV